MITIGGGGPKNQNVGKGGPMDIQHTETPHVDPATLSAENMIQISPVVSEIWPVKLGGGHVYSSRHVSCT